MTQPTPPPTPSPAQQFGSDLAALQATITTLRDRSELEAVSAELDRIQGVGEALARQVDAIRGRGYAEQANLELQLAGIQDRWPEQRAACAGQIAQQSPDLLAETERLQAMLGQVIALAGSVETARPMLDVAMASSKSLAARIDAADASARAISAGTVSEQTALAGQVAAAQAVLNALASSGITLMPNEEVLGAVEAEIVGEGNEDRGVLFVTNQRLMLADREAPAMPSLRLDVPVGSLESNEATKEGFFRNEDHLFLGFGSGAPMPKIHFHLFGQDSRVWQGLLQRASTLARQPPA